MANAGCINAYDCNGCLIQTLQNLDSACIGVGVQYTAPNPLDDKRLDYIKYTDKCGCTCCLSAENEILIYATNGVIKNFTLTNDDVNEAIKIQWNDIFGSNRVKTVVRYKTGSAPVSITDGTLAVEETTKNQYSSTPFSLTGVLDETTYYITAFAVDSNDNVINSQSGSVTTYFGVPKNGLLGYWKLQNDLIDYSGNGNNGTWYGTGNFETSGGYKGARMTNSGSGGNYGTTQHIETNLVYGNRPISICFWFNAYSRGDWCGIISNANESDNLTDYCMRLSGSTGQWHASDLICSLGNNNNNIITTYDINTRYFFVITIDSSGNWKIYRNGNNVVNQGSGGLNATNNGKWRIGARNTAGTSRGLNGLMRYCAIYNRVLSTDEITMFHNKTK